MTDHVLAHILKPLSSHYDDPQIVELRMSAPCDLVLEHRTKGKITTRDADLTQHRVEQLCHALANYRGLAFDPETSPKLSTLLPQGHRFECAVGHSTAGGVSLAIRCNHHHRPSWAEMGIDAPLQSWLTKAMTERQNIIVSGGTNTGKTTLLGRLMSIWPDSLRVVTVEDTPELDTSRFFDASSLLAARDEGSGQKMLTYRQLADHLRRITPDAVVFGEISTTNALPALDALNSGIQGFLCTIHADTPEMALHRKFDQNIAFAGQEMPKVGDFLCELVDAVIQLKRRPDGTRRISDVYLPKSNSFVVRDFAPTAELSEQTQEAEICQEI